MKGLPERGGIARGLGRSYGDPAQNSGGHVLRLAPADDQFTIDAAADTVTVGGGVSLDHLLTVLVPRGYFVPVTPGYAVRHGRRGDRQRHPRQESSRRRFVRLARDPPAADAGRHHDRRTRARPGAGQRPRTVLGHRRRDGADRSHPRRHVPADPDRDQPHDRRDPADRWPRRDHGAHVRARRRRALLGRLARPARLGQAPRAGCSLGWRACNARPAVTEAGRRPARLRRQATRLVTGARPRARCDQPALGGGIQRGLVPQGPPRIARARSSRSRPTSIRSTVSATGTACTAVTASCSTSSWCRSGPNRCCAR